jgi:pyruvate/2-oxoglutarate dehydrogenase complex dihydrolipoamide dehydrogenase (E3) component
MNNQARQVENLILGGGEAGKYIAWELAREGRNTVVVERALIGGSCPNIACLPSKKLIRSAKVADLMRHAGDYGMRTTNGGTDTAMLAGLPYTALRDGIFTHPTMAEGLNVLFANTPKNVTAVEDGQGGVGISPGIVRASSDPRVQWGNKAAAVRCDLNRPVHGD